MKKAIVMSLVIAFCLAVFSSPSTAKQYDPNNWTVVNVANPTNAVEADDGGFNDQDSKSVGDVRSLFGCFDIRITAPTLFFYLFDLIDVSDSTNQGNGKDRESEIVPIGGTL